MLVLALLLAAPADACCAVVVGPADAEPVRRATTVVALRAGKTTVLTLVADVEGSPERLGLLIPVDDTVTPIDVRPSLLEPVERADALSAPRLVELWHHDPCGEGRVPPAHRRVGAPPRLPPLPPLPPAPAPAPAPRARPRPAPAPAPPPDPATVPPYEEIAVLPWTAPEGSDVPTVESWLRDRKLAIPAAARAEVERLGASGVQFAVARPSPAALVREDGRTRLPPIRVRTRGDALSVPLAVAASGGEQELMLLVLASDRYAPLGANHTFAPTGLVLSEDVIGTFAEAWGGLFRTVARPNTVVTEYSWPAATCDPCPVAPLDRSAIGVLGGSLVGTTNPSRFVLTRLHARIDPATAPPALVLGVAPLVSGGNGAPDALETGAVTGRTIAFQTRLVVKHRFTGGVTCDDPDWHRWGGPPRGTPPPVRLSLSQALDPVDPEEAGAVAGLLKDRIAGVAPPPRSALVPPPARPPATPVATGCAGGGSALGLLVLGLAPLRRKRQPSRAVSA